MTHIWKPLDDAYRSTRVFELLPGQPDDKVCLHLHHVALADKEPQYEAISYTWGKDLASISIDVDGQDYTIRRNLHGCLRILRNPDTSRSLWADAICINQTDLTEKARQVSVIGQIFRRAATVRVWLGEQKDGSDRVMAAINRVLPYEQADFSHWYSGQSHRALGRRYPMTHRFEYHIGALLRYSLRYPVKRLRFLQVSAEKLPEMVVKYGRHLLTAKERRDFDQFVVEIFKFLDREYWNRTWIIQEIRLARSIVVHCGPCETSWKKLVIFCCRLASGASRAFRKYEWELAFLPAHALTHPTSGFVDPKHGIDTLVNLVSAFAHTECADAHDKVYATLPMVPLDTPIPGFTVDYTEAALDLFFRLMDAYAVVPPAHGQASIPLQHFNRVRIALKLEIDEILSGASVSQQKKLGERWHLSVDELAEGLQRVTLRELHERGDNMMPPGPETVERWRERGWGALVEARTT